MPTLRLMLRTLFIAIWASAAAASAEPPAHVLVLSIDGLRGDWVANPDKYQLKIPTLRGVVARGTLVESVLGVFPSVTYPSHTTLITGCRPARHGIFANGLFEPPTQKPSEAWYWDYKDIRVPTLLDAARQAGWLTAAIGWPVTLNAPAEILYPEVWPAGNHDDAVIEMSRHSRPPELLAATLTKYDLEAGADSDGARLSVARYVVDRWRPRLMLLHLIDLDHAEHGHGWDSAEARAAIERIDGQLAMLLENYARAGLLERTVVAVVSDHGFLAVKRSFNVNAMLREAGLIRMGTAASAPASQAEFVPAVAWDAAAWTSGGSCAIVLRDPADRATLQRVRDALAPHVGKPESPIRRVLEREDIDRLGSNTRAALMLDPADGWTFSSRLNGNLVGRSAKGMHGQMPDRPELEATFVLAGPGVAAGRRIGRADMIDIAPTLAAMAGWMMPSAEGRALDVAAPRAP